MTVQKLVGCVAIVCMVGFIWYAWNYAHDKNYVQATYSMVWAIFAYITAIVNVK